MDAPRDHELLIAARTVALALGRTPGEVMELAVRLGDGGRRHWSTAELLLTALAHLARQTPTRAAPPPVNAVTPL
ncbi:hypothetical protein [Sphaerisporangium rufum]|uniref:hypothetical protein n=1 Tax=Sphaerisporangium rufum TaxID=1381558 RepID=UPI00194E06F6|nr:hypothetical protein [Sphaerisporangium rufum]